jgi:transposase
VKRELGVGYSTLRRLLEKETDVETLGFMRNEEELYLGIDEHSFKHQELVHTVTEVKQRKVVGILRDDHIATLKKFLSKISRDKVTEVCIDVKGGLRKAVQAVFPLARVIADPFHVVADSVFNLKSADDAELIRWGNTLKHWREPILNHFDNHTTNGFTEGCNTKIKMLKRLSYGLKNVDVYWRKMLLGFVPSRSCFRTI